MRNRGSVSGIGSMNRKWNLGVLSGFLTLREGRKDRKCPLRTARSSHSLISGIFHWRKTGNGLLVYDQPRLETRRWCYIQMNSITEIGKTAHLERGAAITIFRRTGSDSRNRSRDLFLQLPKEFEDIKLREPSQHLQTLAS
jgi:hypothetical protein